MLITSNSVTSRLIHENALNLPSLLFKPAFLRVVYGVHISREALENLEKHCFYISNDSTPRHDQARSEM